MTKTARTTALAALALACAATPAIAGSGRGGPDQSGHNPPGNNGTVKIHQVSGDTSSHDVAHVQCEFSIAFFGFDLNQTADLTLSGQAPTGSGTELWSRDDVLISTDDAGGGRDVDNEIHVTAAALGLERLGAPHPKQGYHLKLDVEVNGAPGGAKHKVFWLEPCATSHAASDRSPSTENRTEAGRVSGLTEVTGDSPPAAAGSNAAHATAASPAETTVLGVRYSRDAAARATTNVLGETLPFTGIPLVGLAAAAALAAGAGVLMLAAGRRRPVER